MSFTTIIEDRLPTLEQAGSLTFRRAYPEVLEPGWGPEQQELPESQGYCAEVGIALSLALV